MRLTIKKGSNKFKIHGLVPIQFNIPFFGKKIEYEVTLGKEWLEDFELSDPAGYGVKLPGMGHWWNYHLYGVNFAIGKENGKLYVWPRYYNNGVLKELTDVKVEIQNLTITVKINAYKFKNFIAYHWYINNKFIFGRPFKHSQRWINNFTPFLGSSGNDWNKDGAVASRDLSMKIRFKLFWRWW